MGGLFEPFISDKGMVILDGALATELESRGADLNHPLWSAKLLSENPALIKAVHLDYLRAGADIITSASYQASFPGFLGQGYSTERARELMQLSVSLALEAKTEACRQKWFKGPQPLVAASIGPYGAYLADGSEYRGDYGLSFEELIQFHRPRIELLAKSGADLLACETIPCLVEAIALIEIMRSIPEVSAWISFSCKDERHLCSGESFEQGIALSNTSDQVIATGLNCTSPAYVESLVHIAAKATSKPIIIYPNNGETWDGVHKCWLPGEGQPDFLSQALTWRMAGATIIGGCCRTSPSDIRHLRDTLCPEK